MNPLHPPASPQPSARPQWALLPLAVRDLAATYAGAEVCRTDLADGGFGDHFAGTLHLADGRAVFAKAAPAGTRLGREVLTEASVVSALPQDAPAPQLLGAGSEGGWNTAVFTRVDGHRPDLSPASDDAASLLGALRTLRTVTAPPAFARAAAPPVAWRGWTLLDDPLGLALWTRARHQDLVALEDLLPEAARGEAIVHGDVRADNAVVRPDGRTVLVDWPHATTGPPWLDLVTLAPQLLLAGHPAEEVHALLTQDPALDSADPTHVLAVLASLTGHWTFQSLQPPPPAAPGLRPYQQGAAAAGLTLLQHLWDRPAGTAWTSGPDKPRAAGAPSPGWPADFAARRQGDGCPLCTHDVDATDIGWGILLAKGPVTNTYLWRSGQVRGYTIVLFTARHVAEPTEMSPTESAAFWAAGVEAGRAIEEFYSPWKVNYLSHGNQQPHAHWHVTPRYEHGDPAPGEPLPFCYLDHGRQDEQQLQADAAGLRELLSDAQGAR